MSQFPTTEELLDGERSTTALLAAQVDSLRAQLTAAQEALKAAEQRCEELDVVNDSLITEATVERGRSETAERDLRLRNERARQCVDYLGVPITNPSGEPFDELSQALQVMPTWTELSALRLRLEAAEKDTKRLDWLTASPFQSETIFKLPVSTPHSPAKTPSPQVRDRIDAAMQDSPKGAA